MDFLEGGVELFAGGIISQSFKVAYMMGRKKEEPHMLFSRMSLLGLLA